MTTTGESRGRRALAALAEMARGSVRPPTPAQLDSGLAALRARMNRGARPRSAARSAILRWSLVGTLAATSALVALGVVRSGRARVPAVSALPALTYRVEGGSLVDGGYLPGIGPRRDQAVLRRGDGVHPEAGDAQPPARGRRLGRAHRHRARRRFVPGHARACQ